MSGPLSSEGEADSGVKQEVEGMVSRLVEQLEAAAVRVQRGQSMIEYALIAALIAVVVMATLAVLGTAINAKFQEIVGKLGG